MRKKILTTYILHATGDFDYFFDLKKRGFTCRDIIQENSKSSTCTYESIISVVNTIIIVHVL